MALNTVRQDDEIKDPPIARFLYGSTKMGLIWLAVRVFVGFQWLNSGYGKLYNPGWMGDGSALKGFWTNAVKIPEAAGAKPVITFDWYRSFLQYLLDVEAYTWFAKVIAVSEVAIGIALIVGFFTGLAAFGGSLMNFNFMLAGTASTNPLLFLLAINLMLAWKVAGYYGADAVLLRNLGTPWQLGALFRGGRAGAGAGAEAGAPAGAGPVGAA
ncbi:MAG TPA: DoxX family membrane protein [Chloroflexota bacterium]|nr:DoxX family membrane protein [Chloroflexota bacterium]